MAASMVCQRTNHDHPFGIFFGENPLTYSFPLVLLEISFVLIVIHLVRFILKPLRQPKIVAEVLGGIIVGPSVLGRNKKFKDFLFPEHSQFMVMNIGLMGLMYFLFVSGVKMDMKLVTKSSRKHLMITAASIFTPLIVVLCVGFSIRSTMDANLASGSSMLEVACTVAITSFPSLHPLVKELNLLSTEVGRTALATTIIGEAFGINALLAFEAGKQGENNSENGIWFVLSALLVLVVFVIIRKLLIRVLARSQGGRPIEQGVVVVIILGALCVGFMTDMFGLAIGHGPLLLGLVIPDGPPLGSVLIEKTETLANNILMPFSFAMMGMLVDISNVVTHDWPTLKPLVVMVLTGYAIKFVATVVASVSFKIPLKDSVSLGLLLNMRGQVELFLFVHWMEKKMIQPSYFTMLALITVVITGVSTPLVSLLSYPAKPYMTSKRRTIQHTAIGGDLRIMLTVEKQEDVGGLVSLLEASSPSAATPFSVTVLCLIDLIGRASPVFINHNRLRMVPRQYAACLTIHNAFRLYKKFRGPSLKLDSYTAITPRSTVYQDICEIAMINKSTLIILIFDREGLEAAGRSRAGVRSVNTLVLDNAPCSVGIFVDKGHFTMNPITVSNSCGSNPHVAVLFFGGADSREALALAERMLSNDGVRMTVIRFLAFQGKGDNDMEKKLDDGVVTWFWVKNEANDRLIYREVIVRNGAETIAAIQSVEKNLFDLWVVGKENGVNPVLLKGLSEWTENQHELGTIGDYIAGSDLGDTGSVLVIQQQILREQGSSTTTAGSRGPAKFIGTSS